MSSARLADQARQAHRAAVNQRHAPAPAEHAEGRVILRHAQIAPQRELQTTRHGITRHRRDHGLGEPHPRRAHRRVGNERIVLLLEHGDAVAAPLGHAFQIGAGAKRAARAPQHGGQSLVVTFEFEKGLRQGFGRRAVNGVARGRAVDDDGGYRPVALDAHICHSGHRRFSLALRAILTKPRADLAHSLHPREAIP
ncbi:MAG TPA: hypothetical protein VN932_10795 [Rhizomicrobium sp.]|nr:hypothetical protein [Rhizomicrobium sp.]